MKIAILVLCTAALAGAAAALSAHRLAQPRATTATEELAPAERASAASSLGAGPPAPPAAHTDQSPFAAAGDTQTSDASQPGAAGQPGRFPLAEAAPVPGPAQQQPAEADDVAPPQRAPHPPAAIRINPVSGEQMWSARDVIREGSEADQPLCGGQLCRAGQFCCGPPECGRCAYAMAGPHCPGTCPGQKSN